MNGQQGGTVNWHGEHYGTVSYGSDANLNVVFYKRSVHDEWKSREQGLPIYNDVDFIKIMQPGEQLNVIERPCNQGDKLRFPRQWSMYLNNETQTPEGTPIELLFPNSPAQADSLKTFGIKTVQQCAAMTEHAMSTVGMGGLDLKLKAQKYLDAAKDGGNFHLMQKELDAKETKIKELTSRMDQQAIVIADLVKRLENPELYSKTAPVVVGNPDIQSERINGVAKEVMKNVK